MIEKVLNILAFLVCQSSLLLYVKILSFLTFQIIQQVTTKIESLVLEATCHLVTKTVGEEMLLLCELLKFTQQQHFLSNNFSDWIRHNASQTIASVLREDNDYVDWLESMVLLQIKLSQLEKPVQLKLLLYC